VGRKTTAPKLRSEVNEYDNHFVVGLATNPTLANTFKGKRAKKNLTGFENLSGLLRRNPIFGKNPISKLV